MTPTPSDPDFVTSACKPDEFPSLHAFNTPGWFSLTVEADGHGHLFILPTADLTDPGRCEQLLKLIMVSVGVDVPKD